METNVKNKFSPIVFFKEFIEKTKGCPAFLIFCSVLSASVVGTFFKVLLGRARPVFFEALNMVGFFPGARDWAFHSMPSGHTMATFAGLVMMGMLFPKYKGYTWTLAIVVGISRVCVGAHWPTDVLFGAFIGMVCADLVKWYFARKIK